MVKRHYWIQRIEEAWRRRSLVWLSGVRRAGKTTLCEGLEKIEYFDCELPRTRMLMEDPEAFLEKMGGKRVVLDEIHRLANPSELLKIASDHFKDVKIVATGSSTLQASSKFRDALTGRKEEVWLTPMNHEDLEDFGPPDLSSRLQKGGLPPFFLADRLPEREFQEWIDSYWAKDVQELFHLEKRAGFQRFLELLFLNSGGIFEATAYAAPCEISRITVANYLAVLEATRVVRVVRPFSKRSSSEIISAPKVYTFDTGFIVYYKGWQELRDEDKGTLWEHYILNEFLSRVPADLIHYWRDKRGHEIDFVYARRGRPPVAIECKWSSKAFDIKPLLAFRTRFPQGENWIVSSDVDRSFQKKQDGLILEYLGMADLIQRLKGPL